jgi:hypothetical protein
MSHFFGRRYIISNNGGTGTGGGDGYYPFIEIDQLSISGSGSGTLENTIGAASSGSIMRIEYNDFLIGNGLLEIKGLTLRSTIDSNLTPTITYDVLKGATLVDAGLSQTELSGGEMLVTAQATTSIETYISGIRKDSNIQFTTGTINLDASKFDSIDSTHDGDFYFIFHGSHTSDTKTILVSRNTLGPKIEHIAFTYPICSFSSTQQTAVRSGQSFGISVTTQAEIGRAHV